MVFNLKCKRYTQIHFESCSCVVRLDCPEVWHTVMNVVVMYVAVFVKYCHLSHCSNSGEVLRWIVSKQSKTLVRINTCFINWSIGLNDHTLPSRLQLISMISVYGTYVNIIYCGRCNKPIAGRNEVLVRIVVDTYCVCTVLRYSTNYVR